MTLLHAYFIGVRPGAHRGHHCFMPDFRPAHTSPENPSSPWVDRDVHGSLLSSAPFGEGAILKAVWGMSPEQPEGLARVQFRENWMLVSMWDRSADDRPGSHASFALLTDPPLTDPQAGLFQAWAAFPTVFARIETHLHRRVILDPEQEQP